MVTAALRACSPLPSVSFLLTSTRPYASKFSLSGACALQMARVGAAFLQPEVTTLAWLHLLLLDLFQARCVDCPYAAQLLVKRGAYQAPACMSAYSSRRVV